MFYGYKYCECIFVLLIRKINKVFKLELSNEKHEVFLY